MAKERFVCDSCDGEGTITFRQNESRFKYEINFCPFCGGDLDTGVDEDVEEDEDF